MNIMFNIIHVLFPLISIVLIVLGIKNKKTLYITAAIWLSIIALVLHYHFSGGEILGSYFDYINAAVYSVNLILMMICLIYLLSTSEIRSFSLRLLNSFFKALLIIGALIVIMNLWINAYFISERMSGTPILQVSNPASATHCQYKYVFYKVGKDGKIHYLCPNKYGLIPGVATIESLPDFILNQLSKPALEILLKHQQDKKQDD